MMEEIITLIIHEAVEREGTEIAYKLKEVVGEINLITANMSTDLLAIKQMEISEPMKAEMVALVLGSHKT